MKEVINISEVEKTFEQNKIAVRAIRGITLKFYPGEFTAIVGPSGSGKTTLLNMIGGIIKPSGGEILIGETLISQLSENQMTEFRKKNLGFVFQSYNLIPVLTARENIELVMELLKTPKTDQRKRSSDLLESIGLMDKRNVKPAFLSGGQQQRIAVARALASYPSLVLADEPTANLDSNSASELLSIMEKLNKKEKIMFIFSTHDERVIKRARRIIVIEDGKVKSDKTVKSTKKR